MKGLSKGRYDKTFAGEDEGFGTYRICVVTLQTCMFSYLVG